QWSNRRGQTALSTYNGARLLTSWSASDGLRSSYSYDGHRNLVTASNHSGRVVYQYDGADRLTNMIAPDGKWLRLSYDTGGRRSQLRTSEGFEVNYSYDSVGRLYELRDAAAGLIVRYDYDVAGRLIEAYRGNGVRTVYAYDIANRIAGLIHYKPDDLFLSYYNYQYNDEGWPSVISSQQGLWSNRYDAAGQLTSAEFHTFDTNIPDQSLTYTYDNDGNRMLTVINGATTRYAANTMDQYTSVGPENLSYDQDGNLVSRDDGTNAWVYSYDSLNRLTNAVTPQGVWRYEYDALGRRVAKVEDGARTDYLLDPTGMGHVISEYSFGHTAQYAHGLGLASCTMPSNNLTCYYHYDARGSARQLTGTTGALLNTSFYLPFGEQIVPQQTLTNAFGFVGQLGVMQES
ncbi:MAG: RHS repeat protein, partial [Spartobacteria bacterium]|nr:RHS repeat protein [Spartobacteria bacterium]